MKELKRKNQPNQENLWQHSINGNSIYHDASHRSETCFIYFTSDIQHISGAYNVVANALSHIENIAVPNTINYANIVVGK